MKPDEKNICTPIRAERSAFDEAGSRTTNQPACSQACAPPTNHPRLSPGNRLPRIESGSFGEIKKTCRNRRPRRHRAQPGRTAFENSETRQLEWQNFARKALKRAVKLLKEFLWDQRMYHFEARLNGIAAQCTALRVLPEAGVNRFSRYENHLTRKILNLLHELERMQRLRRGEKLPPPSARVS